MAPVSRLEINFRRLLLQCESIAADKIQCNWRFENYISALEDKLLELKKLNVCQPSNDTLAEYTRKVEFLRGLIVAEKLSTTADKAAASQLLSPGPPPVSGYNKMKEIQLQTQVRYANAMREELLGKKNDFVGESNGLRQRVNTSEDLDSLLQYHNTMQEKVAEEMVSLVRNLKENTLLAGKIVRKDNETLTRSSELADKNFKNLKVESERLEQHVQKACNWLMWIMLGVVCCTFMWCIVFIRLFPKR